MKESVMMEKESQELHAAKAPEEEETEAEAEEAEA